MSVKSRRQALKLCLDAMVVVIIQIVNKFSFKMFHRFKLLQIQQRTFKQSEKVINDRIVQTVAFTAHGLPDILFLEHPLVLLIWYCQPWSE